MTTLDQLVTDTGVRTVRCVWVDAQGQPRGKAIDATTAGSVAERGIAIPGSLLHKDTANTYAVPLWDRTGDEVLDHLLGAANLVLRPDPTTFAVLPWAPDTGWVLCDAELDDATPVPHSTRAIAARGLAALAAHGFEFRAGLEMEFTLYRRLDSGGMTPAHAGWDLLGEATLDVLEPQLAPIVSALGGVGLAPRTVEAELGPGQVELTFGPTEGLTVADQAILARTTIRQVARRNGLHATFMSRPAPPGTSASFPSGWHLHQSLVRDGDPVFVPTDGSELLSTTGRHWVAGLLEHAASACLLTTPTVTGYKRYRSRAVTPDRITWARDHRGAMLRALGGAGDPATRVENRAGDPAANPYLLVAAQVIAGLDGLRREVEPPPPTDTPYEAADAALLPRSLGEAIDAFAADPLWSDALGADVAAYLQRLRTSDWSRFLAAVTDWEQAEYFERF